MDFLLLLSLGLVLIAAVIWVIVVLQRPLRRTPAKKPPPLSDLCQTLLRLLTRHADWDYDYVIGKARLMHRSRKLFACRQSAGDRNIYSLLLGDPISSRQVDVFDTQRHLQPHEGPILAQAVQDLFAICESIHLQAAKEILRNV